ITAQQYELAAELRDREVKLREKIEKLESGQIGEPAKEGEVPAAEAEAQPIEKPKVTEEHIAEVVAMWTGIPVVRINQEESAKLLQMEDALHKKVIGQDEPIKALARAVRRARAGLKDPKRPIGSFIFLGPTGVGKTLMARVLAEFLFGSQDAMIKIDM